MILTVCVDESFQTILPYNLVYDITGHTQTHTATQIITHITHIYFSYL